MKVLLTGGSGFIAAWIVDALLENGHVVVFTVRSDEKGEKILSNHSGTPKSKLSYVIVKDINQADAFDEAVKSDPPFEAVIHSASPFHYDLSDPKKNLIDPAVNGTTGILKSIKANAPSVKRVVITSSFAAIMNGKKHASHYDETVWNPVTMKDVEEDPSHGYRASKTFAEKAAWEFIEKERPGFSLTTINPPMVYGPIVSYLNSLDAVNTSNQRFRDMMQGKMKEKLAPSGGFTFVDVRDVALAHVRAAERPEAAGKRFFCIASTAFMADLADAVKKNFPEYRDKLPAELKSDAPNQMYTFDNSRSKEVLGLEYRPLEQCVIDTVNSLKALGL